MSRTFLLLRRQGLKRRLSTDTRLDVSENKKENPPIEFPVFDPPTRFSSRPNTQIRRCYLCGMTGHESGDCTAPFIQKVCKVCGVHGHLARNCENRTHKFCKACGSMDHETESCTNREALRMFLWIEKQK